MSVEKEVARLYVTIAADTKGFFSQMSKVSLTTNNLGASIGKTFAVLGKAVVASTVAIGAAAGKITLESFNAAKSFESAFTGVKKTVEETANTTYPELEEAIRSMAKEIPSSVEEISKVVEIAGQLGISADDVMQFSRTMIDLGNTTNFSAEEGAMAMAKFLNITGTAPDMVDELGSVIVHLGNNMATTEADIMNMGFRLAGLSSITTMSADEILALAATLSSLGIKAEAGGSSVTKIISEMNSAVAKGGKELETFAKVSGMSMSAFSEAFTGNTTDALFAFLGGLTSIEEQGGNTLLTLESIGLSNVRVRDVLLRTSQATDLYTNALTMSNEAFSDFDALSKEANLRYGTTESRLTILKNTVNDLAISFGQKLLPEVNRVATELTNILKDGFQDQDMEKISNLLSTTLNNAILSISGSMPAFIATMSSAISEGIGLIVTLLPTLLPAVVDGFVAILDGLLTAWETNKERINEAALYLIETLSASVITNIPILGELALEMLLSLANGLIKNLPAIKDDVILMIGKLIDIVLENLSLIVELGAQLLVVMVDAMNDSDGILKDKIPAIVGAIVKAFIENIDTFIQCGIDLFVNMMEGFADNATYLATAIPKVASAIITALMEIDWWQVGKDIISAIANGIFDNAGVVNAAATSVAAGAAAGASGPSNKSTSTSTKSTSTSTKSSTTQGIATNVADAARRAAGQPTFSIPKEEKPNTGYSYSPPTTYAPPSIGGGGGGGGSGGGGGGGGGGSAASNQALADAMSNFNPIVTVIGTIRHEGISAEGELVEVVDQIVRDKLQWETLLAGG